MMNYTTVGSNKLDQAKTFYDGLLASINAGKVFDHPSGGRLYGKVGSWIFGVLGPYDGKPATAGNGSLVGFGFPSREEVGAFHAKALEMGATCDGPPGERSPGAYFAYFRDLDGNKICAYKFG